MSKLGVFSYIEEACAILESKRARYEENGEWIAAYFEKTLGGAEETVGITYRIKTAASLKEKLVRNSLYKQYTSHEVVGACSDIIGVRVECRFLDDEKTVYGKLCQLFGVPCEEAGEGYFRPEGEHRIMLKLGPPQPEKQKNGLSIYRIDGCVFSDGERYNFELQVKSLVNSFWSEIEHNIIYKNKHYMLIDDFVSELMGSINENLKNIDRQLNMLFHRCVDASHSEHREALENFLLTLINEVYSRLVEKRAGISANIKPYSQALVKYILGFSTFTHKKSKPVKSLPEDAPYGGTVVRFMDWLRRVDFNDIRIGERIELPEVVYETEMQAAVGKKLISEMNEDFFCNTFFHILFSVEVGNDLQDFASYLRYYERRIGADEKSAEGKRRLLEEIEQADAGKLVLEKEIVRLSQIQ